MRSRDGVIGWDYSAGTVSSVRIEEVLKPTRCVIFYDYHKHKASANAFSWQWHYYNALSSGYNGDPPQGWNYAVPDGQIIGYHGKALAFLYCDGHVKLEEPVRLNYTLRLEGYKWARY